MKRRQFDEKSATDRFGDCHGLGASSATAGIVGFEAESGTFVPPTPSRSVYNVVSDATASGGVAIEPSAANFGMGADNASVVYEVDFPEAGVYYLYARITQNLNAGTSSVDFRTSISTFPTTPITNGNLVNIWGSFTGVTDVTGTTFAPATYSVFNLSTGSILANGLGSPTTYEVLSAGTQFFQFSNRNANVVIDGFVFSTDEFLTEEEFLAAVPEPASLALVMAGIGLIGARRRG